ncbi:MAG: MaoC family dehydratase N-terminal domain-containing protein [Oscillospiraceae bacterium]|nr:MaoC family dehydratase N-terminal domain-containing protein [Oscillospiraceae bacterium]
MGVLHYDFKGMLYDEWEENHVYTTAARTITDADVNAYCAISGDYNPLYTNKYFAESSIYGKPVVPGALTFIITNGLDCQTLWVDGSYIGLLDQQQSFKKPVYVGDTIYLTMTPVAKRLSRKPGRGIITYRMAAYNQNDELVMDGTWVILMATDRDHME